jgi:hypothetical protein
MLKAVQTVRKIGRWTDAGVVRQAPRMHWLFRVTKSGIVQGIV